MVFNIKIHFCNWFGKRHRDLKSHWTRGCASAPRSKVGSKAEAAMKKAKAAKIHKAVVDINKERGIQV